VHEVERTFNTTKVRWTGRTRPGHLGKPPGTSLAADRDASPAADQFRGVRVLSLTVQGAARTTISDARGKPVTVFGASVDDKLKVRDLAPSVQYTARKISMHCLETSGRDQIQKARSSPGRGIDPCPAGRGLLREYESSGRT